eukprot:6751011-Ditylum_brightwellii.AAC.1
MLKLEDEDDQTNVKKKRERKLCTATLQLNGPYAITAPLEDIHLIRKSDCETSDLDSEETSS